MTITSRCLALCGLAAVLVACGEDPDDYRSMTPDKVCELVTLDEARGMMRDITDRSLNMTKEHSAGLPACRYGSGDGRPYLQVKIHQSSQLKAGGDVAETTVAGQQALQRESSTSCSVFVPLNDLLYLLAIVESWDSSKDTCPVSREAIEKAHPRLTK